MCVADSINPLMALKWYWHRSAISISARREQIRSENLNFIQIVKAFKTSEQKNNQ